MKASPAPVGPKLTLPSEPMVAVLVAVPLVLA